MMRTSHIFLAVAIFSRMVFANAEDIADYSEYYKNYYETHSAQERQPAISRQGLEALATPETALVIGGAGLAAGLLGLYAYIDQRNDVNEICTTAKALGDTSLTTTSTSNMAAMDPASTGNPTDAELTAYNALIIARLNLIESAINGYATPSC